MNMTTKRVAPELFGMAGLPMDPYTLRHWVVAIQPRENVRNLIAYCQVLSLSIFLEDDEIFELRLTDVVSIEGKTGKFTTGDRLRYDRTYESWYLVEQNDAEPSFEDSIPIVVEVTNVL